MEIQGRLNRAPPQMFCGKPGRSHIALFSRVFSFVNENGVGKTFFIFIFLGSVPLICATLHS